MRPYDQLQARLRLNPKTWLITGVAGFIGSNLLEALLRLDQRVVGLDNFSTGHPRNLQEVRAIVGEANWSQFRMIEGDIRNPGDCATASSEVDYVLHQAALGSVPRSIEDPIATNATNISGFLNMIVAARDARVTSFVYAASSSTYGDHPGLPKVEDRIGKPLSPYAVTKFVNELYADVFSRCYGMTAVGLRYFNVFGPRQDPNGPYAAVIPRWTAAMIKADDIFINGDGSTSRDFCYIENVVQANLLAATAAEPAALNTVFNIAVGGRTTLNELFCELRDALAANGVTYSRLPLHRPFREGDVRHSQADITKARERLGYNPTFDARSGIRSAMPWYLNALST